MQLRINLFSLYLVIHLLNKNINTDFKMAWIILILAIPSFGVMFYLFCQMEITSKKLKKELLLQKNQNKQYLPSNLKVLEEVKKKDYFVYQTAKYLNNVGHFPIYEDPRVKYFRIGEEFYEDFLKQLEKAQKYIFLEFFIIANDEMWNRVLNILKRKVKEGVEVRVLYDGTCSFMLLPHDYPQILRKYGIKCQVFSPVVPIISTYYNNRDHRKIAIIDGALAYTGGINLANEYINVSSKYGHWKDNMICFEGASVNSMIVLFLEMWDLESKEKASDISKYLTNETSHEQGYLIPFGDDPFDNEQIGKSLYMDILKHAKDYVYIIMPYLILDGELLNTFIHTAKKGVKIKLILPGIADKKVINYIAHTYYKDLLDANIEIYEYTPGFTHAKMFICDDIYSVIGTINLDYRSLYLHFEDGVFLAYQKEIIKMKEDFLDTLQKSKLITKESLKKYPVHHLLIGRIMRLLAPLL